MLPAECMDTPEFNIRHTNINWKLETEGDTVKNDTHSLRGIYLVP